MGLISEILGGREHRELGDYAELDAEDAPTGDAEATMHVRVAEVGDKQDALEIKDAVYDGDLVIADITRMRTKDDTTEHIVDDLRRV